MTADIRRRLDRLEQRQTDSDAGPLVTIWMPYNGRDDQPPGVYREPGSHVVMVIYDSARPELLPPDYRDQV